MVQAVINHYGATEGVLLGDNVRTELCPASPHKVLILTCSTFL